MKHEFRHLHGLFLGSFSLLVAAILLGRAPAALTAGSAHYDSAFTSDNRETRKDLFTPETPKVYVTYALAEVPQAAMLKIVWIAEKLEGFQENSKIAESKKAAGTSINGVFSYSKPPKGWPAGTYRVELFIDDKLDKTLKFRVVR